MLFLVNLRWAVNTYVKWKQKIKSYARYSPFLNRILHFYLSRKTIRESLPELIRESTRFYQILKQKGINVVLDVGAHSGITGINLRDHGYTERIISFEPISDVFMELRERAQLAPPWESYNIALGKEAGKKNIKILGNKPASSFLEGKDLLRKELQRYGGGEVQREELVEVKRLDDLFFSLCQQTDRVLLKIDTQGYEKQVLEGSLNSLKQISLVKIETSLVEIYEGETLLHEMVSYMERIGYIPILIERGHVSEETCHQLQADIVFANSEVDPENWTG